MYIINIKTNNSDYLITKLLIHIKFLSEIEFENFQFKFKLFIVA